MISVRATTPQVTLQQPAQAKVSEAAEAINDKMLVDVAIDKFGGNGGAGGDVASKASTTVPKAVKTSVVGVAKGPMNHLVRLSLSVMGRGRVSFEDRFKCPLPGNAPGIFPCHRPVL